MSPLAHLVVLAVLLSALRGRVAWTRLGGLVLTALAVAGLAAAWSSPVVRTRLADPDLWPGVAFVWVASGLAWWTMRREQRRTTPIHEEDPPESFGRFIPLSVSVLGVATVLVVSAFVPAPVGLPPGADAVPTLPWYLLGLAELSRHLGPLLAWALIPAAAVTGLVATPRLDTSRPETEGPFRGRRDEAPFFLWAWLGLGLAPLTVALFGPGPVTPLSNVSRADVSLAEWFWLDVAGSHEPASWVLREAPGLLILAVVAVVLPIYLPRWTWTHGVFGRHLRRLGRRRYVLLCSLLAVFMLVPVGLLVRAFGFGPWLRLGGGWWL